jgi:hypothetical protein
MQLLFRSREEAKLSKLHVHELGESSRFRPSSDGFVDTLSVKLLSPTLL